MALIKKEIQKNKKKMHSGIVGDIYHAQYEGINHPIEIIDHPECVAIAATFDGTNFFMVKQFRFPVDDILLEFPAGKVNPNENIDSAALRELEEEIGYHAKSLHALGYIFSSPGISNEKLHLFYATDLIKTQQNLDDEFLNVTQHSLSKISTLISEGTINDSKTIALMYRLQNFLGD